MKKKLDARVRPIRPFFHFQVQVEQLQKYKLRKKSNFSDQECPTQHTRVQAISFIFCQSRFIILRGKPDQTKTL